MSIAFALTRERFEIPQVGRPITRARNGVHTYQGADSNRVGFGASLSETTRVR
jgi:hypothetical protein